MHSMIPYIFWIVKHQNFPIIQIFLPACGRLHGTITPFLGLFRIFSIFWGATETEFFPAGKFRNHDPKTQFLPGLLRGYLTRQTIGKSIMATMRDVAKVAGVAPITVSRVLNSSGYVSPETRERVEAAATELNYVPNMLAHSLRSKSTRTIALMLADITNPFWTSVARGVEDAASKQGFIVIFCNTDENAAKEEQYLSMLLRRRVDGVLLVPISSSGETVEQLQAQGVEVVLLDRRVEDALVDVVRGDSFGGAYRLIRHLTDLGHREIAILNGSETISVSTERLNGYLQALQEVGIERDQALIFHGHFTVESGYAMTRQLLAQPIRPTALFTANNFIAIGALRALSESKLRMPEEISIVSFDDLPFTYSQDQLITVAAQPTYDLGAIATRRLLKRITTEEKQSVEEIIVPVDVIIRSSTCPPQVV